MNETTNLDAPSGVWVDAVIRPTFSECLVCAANTPELVSEFDRLTEHNLSRIGSGLDLAIDDASGRTEQGMRDFIAFVRDCIYRTLVD